MKDLRDEFRALEAEAARLPRPSPSEVRRDTERRRRNGRIAVGAAGLAFALIGVITVTRVVGGESDRITTVALSPSPTPSATESRAAVDGPWLPAPWRLEHTASYTWAGGTTSTYQFCADAMLTHTNVAVTEQRLDHPSGLRARLLTLTPEGEDPMNLFKFTYASCVADGHAESIGGPRNVWSYDGAAGAAEVVGGALRLVEVTGQSPQQPSTQRDAESALDMWTPPGSRS